LDDHFGREEIGFPEPGRWKGVMRIQISFVWVSGMITERPFDQAPLRVF
jgi:hypothetical protein